MKYIFVSGGVISGIGKGVVTASISLLLKNQGFKVTPIKCENYLNVDSGLINPIEHGDPFLCDDGTEADMDMGTYEKFLNQDMGRHNFITMGQIYKAVIDRERAFGYRGEDVEAVPHVCEEIISRIENAGSIEKSDFTVVELGGTVGEYQNVLYYEASRILKYAKEVDVMHVHVSYLPVPSHLGEPKSKPTQLSIKMLNQEGIQPDFLVARSEKSVDQRRRDRLALFCGVKKDLIFDCPDVENVYEVPLILENQEMTQKILKYFNISARKHNNELLQQWQKFVYNTKNLKNELTIAIVGKYFQTGDYKLRDSYAALFDALDHAAWQLGCKMKTQWINSEKVEKDGLPKDISKCDGVVVPIGWGARGAEGMITGIKHARENKIPYLGLCFGMQLAVVEYARNVLGLKNANSTEINENTADPVVHIIPSKAETVKRRAYGGTMRLGKWECEIKKETLSREAYKKDRAWERHRHRYEVNNDYREKLTKTGLVISGESTVEPLVEIIELPRTTHPFFLATQFHPEYKSRPLSPHPLFMAFLQACLKEKKKV
jgi:CTP synthase